MQISNFSLTELLSWLTGLAAAVLGLFKLGKHIMKTVEADKLTTTVVNNDITSFKRLQQELVDLKAEMALMRARSEELERRWNRLRDIELAGATDLGMLTAYIQSMPCGRCNAPDDIFAHIEAVIERMTERRNEKATIFQEG